MIVEGNGLQQPPAPKKYKLARSELILALDTATRIADGRQYRNSNQRWKRGLTGGLTIPGIASNVRNDVAPYVVGLAGEIAVALCFGAPIDDRILGDGDNGADFHIGKARIQVKTRKSSSSHSSSKLNLVRAVGGNGKVQFPKVPLLVFCELNMCDWTVSILGWCRVSRLRSLPLVDARKGDHKNVEVPDHTLEPIGSLRSLIA